MFYKRVGRAGRLTKRREQRKSIKEVQVQKGGALREGLSPYKNDSIEHLRSELIHVSMLFRLKKCET